MGKEICVSIVRIVSTAPRHWALPGPAAFVRDVAAKARDCGVALVASPSHCLPRLEAALSDALRQRWEPIIEAGCPQSPIAALGGIFEIEARSAADIPKQVKAEGKAVIIVGLNETTWPRWETTLRAFTAASKGGSRFRPVIVALLTPECEGSARAIGAPLIPWRNVIGYRDAMLWALEHLPERNDPLLDRLVAETAVQLAGWELDEVARLVEIFSSTVGRMFEPSECLRKSPLAPDWASGSADWLDGNGFRALRCCDSNEIARRVWQAQANVLFSWLETERLNFLRRYRRDFGGCQDPDSLEWADIAEIMKTKFGPRDRRSQLAAEARRARNALAHLKTISLDDLRRIRSLVQMDMRVK